MGQHLQMPLNGTVFVTFTSFDDPSITSAGNLTLLNKGGVIGLFQQFVLYMQMPIIF